MIDIARNNGLIAAVFPRHWEVQTGCITPNHEVIFSSELNMDMDYSYLLRGICVYFIFSHYLQTERPGCLIARIPQKQPVYPATPA